MGYLLLSNEIIAELVPKEKRKERTQKLIEEDEDQLLFKEAAYALSGKGQARLVDPPSWIKEEVMTEYEMAGVKKLLKLYENHMNGLIATEMGLSKFKQVLCFLGYLSKFMAIKGPHLIISPDMDKWMTEIKRILPSLRATKDMGAPFKKKSFQIYVTNEQNLSEKKTRAKKKWEYIIVDGAPQSDISLIREGNERTRCLHIINSPLKDDLRELSSILYYLMPQYLKSSDEVFSKLQVIANANQEKFVQQLHSVLHLFFFGRSRPDNGEQWPQMAEVVLEVGMSSMQKKKLRELYKMPQDPTHDAYNVDQALKQAVQLLKCSNHPFLFKKSKFCDSSKEELIRSAGKMVLLDELLQKLELRGSKILLFSQVCGMLDIIEEYLKFREYQFVRIDENSTLKDCNEAADSFSSPAKKIFICLLSTRVGVLSGLPADTVILYDSSWNQNTDWEAQYCAMSEVVQVYRLSTMRTFEQSLIDRLYPPIDEDGEDDEATEDDDPYFADVDSLVMGMRWHGPTICESEKSTIATVDEIVREGIKEMDKNIRKILAHKN